MQTSHTLIFAVKIQSLRAAHAWKADQDNFLEPILVRLVVQIPILAQFKQEAYEYCFLNLKKGDFFGLPFFLFITKLI
jgi:hypothetical protein